MKKLFLTFSILLLLASPTFAVCNYMNRCASYQGPKNIWTPPFVEQFAQNIIRNELFKATNQTFDVVLHSYSIGDLLSGKFKSLEISGKNVEISGFHFSSLKLATLCDYNSIDINSRPIRINENMVIGVWAELTASDLVNTIQYKDYLSKANSANLSAIGLSSYRIYPNTINVADSKLYFTVNAVPKGSYKPFEISVGADLRVQNANMVASKIDLINLYTGFDLSQISDFLAAINNWNFPFSLTGNDKSEIQIQNIHIEGNRIFIDATIFIPKT